MLKKGALTLSMGGVPEVAFECLDEFGQVIVDDLDYALPRGDLATLVNEGRISEADPLERIDGNIGEVVSGKKRVRRNEGREKRVFRHRRAQEVPLDGLSGGRADG